MRGTEGRRKWREMAGRLVHAYAHHAKDKTLFGLYMLCVTAYTLASLNIS